MNAARKAILERIRIALGERRGDDTPHPALAGRPYRTQDTRSPRDRLDLFAERLREYKAAVFEIAPDALARTIAECCATFHVGRLVVAPGVPESWLPGGSVEILRDDAGLSNPQLESSQGVLTGCAIAIAETGTIILDAGPDQGRRVVTLLPDVHLCVVREDQIVGLVAEAVAGTRGSATRPQTWISGPSATSDIELNRVEGVHGPRTLVVIVVTS